MRRYFYASLTGFFLLTLTSIFNAQAGMFQDKNQQQKKHTSKHRKKFKPQRVVEVKDGEEEENEKYDGIKAAQEHEFNITHDLTTNTIPKNRLVEALAQRNRMIKDDHSLNGINSITSTISTLSWVERGSNADVAGPYGNQRDNDDVTAGRIAAFWNDADPAKPNQVFIGGIDGGLWTCPDITISAPAWTFIDNFSNIAISGICQDPTNVNVMYFGTGEKTFNADAVRGGGVWKSTDHGVTWNILANTTTFYNVSKILCDNAGNVYVATIGSGAGLQRSLNGGGSWAAITPTVSALTTSRVADMVYDATADRMHVYMGYFPTAGVTLVGYCYGTPSTVTSATWSVPTVGSGVTIAVAATPSTATAYEQNALLAVKNGVVWALRGNTGNMVLYRSIDGGDNWTLQKTLVGAQYGIAQDWYSMGLDCDPVNPANNIIFGNLNMFRSTDAGATITQVSEWVTGNYAGQTEYVHADIHNVFYGASRVVVCGDGGVFYSENTGTTWRDRNRGLRIKQFYSCATNPSLPDYFLAGAQDNGSHQFTQPGLGSSTEVTGGDGAFVSIDQVNSTNQVTSYVFNAYHISTDNGINWSSNTFGSSAGQFINPFDFDSKTKKLYAAYTAGNYLRWDNPTTLQNVSAIIAVPALAGRIITAVTVSPNLANTIYLATAGSVVVKVTNANTATPIFTTITPPGSTGSISSISIGPSSLDNDILVTSSTYGAQKVFISGDGGGSWTDITGTSLFKLPDMPIRWGIFYPGSNSQILLATEAGVWYTSAVSGTATIWQPSAGLPAVRSDMIRYSATNDIIAVGTHGRGLWTTKISTVPKISFSAALLTVSKETVATTAVCRTYKDYTVNLNISDGPTGTATVTLSVMAGGTAIQGVDFDFTTNGNFAAPSNIVNFNNVVFPNSIPVTFRIYDNHNNLAPQPQVALINFAITGATDAVASVINNSYTLNISDLLKPALPPTVPAANQVIWSENWTPTALSFSNWTFIPDAIHTTVPNVNAFIPFFSGCANNINQTTAELLTTDAAGNTAFCGNEIGGVSTAMFYRAVNAGGRNAASNLAVTFNYKSAGGANGITNTLEYSTNGGTTWTVIASYGTAAATTAVTTALPALLNNANFLLGWRFTATAATPANTIGFSVDDIFLRGDVITTPIETAAASTATMYETTGQSIDYYSGANNIIATIDNPTADLGCVTTAIEEAGTVWQSFQSGTRSQKTFLITPSQNIGAGYNATLFFTNAELAGNTPATLKIAKTTAASFAAATAGNTVLVTPTNVTYGTLGVAFTGAFTGFSRFALVTNTVLLPVSLVEFKATLVNSTGLLQWNTSSELNSRDFEIEKSNDGVIYNKIGTVKAVGTSTAVVNYTFSDSKLNALNYYRLRINDIDGKNTLSNVVLLKYNNAKQNLSVLNNPFTSEINVRLAQLPTQKIVVELFDQKGSRVYNKTFNSGTEINVNALAGLTAGTYFLLTTVDGVIYTNKVIKQ
ncbi:MAG: T9SS type A sorting domain-containing protein [Ferruginibacter sp.]